MEVPPLTPSTPEILDIAPTGTQIAYSDANFDIVNPISGLSSRINVRPGGGGIIRDIAPTGTQAPTVMQILISLTL